MNQNPSLEAYTGESALKAGPSHLSYLAAPFTSDAPAVQSARRDAVKHVSGVLVQNGHVVFSPLEYTEGMQKRGVFPPQGWYAFDLVMLQACQELIILELPGWKTSYGVIIEVATAKAMNIPVTLMTMEQANLPPEITAILTAGQPPTQG